MEFLSESVEDTFALAKNIAKDLRGGEIILLNGDLGAGKTTFTKGLAHALNIKNTVTSPTFTIMKSYYGDFKLNHLDMYRIEDSLDIYELGVEEEIFDENSISVIEWNKLKTFPQNSRIIEINIKNCGDFSRAFEIKINEKEENPQ